MGHSVTIEGSVTPSVELPAGERRTVAVTQHIRNLVRIGAVVVVDGSLDAPKAPANAAGITRAEITGVTQIITPDADQRTDSERHADEQAHGDGPDADGVPAHNASSEVWRKFVSDRIPGLTYADVEDKKRGELIGAWDRYQQQVNGGG